MLGGSVAIALVRMIVSIGGVMLLFFLISESRFEKRRTVAVCLCAYVVLLGITCVWYAISQQVFARMGALVTYLLFGIFAVWISRDSVYVCMYKLALVFYLMSVFMIGGIEIAVFFFGRNVWADIAGRIVLLGLIAWFINAKIKNTIRGFSDYVEFELDRFSMAIMMLSLFFGIAFILNPKIQDQTPYRLMQIAMNFFLTGILQILVFRLYLHIGIEQTYMQENQLMEMNHRLLERHMALLAAAGEEEPSEKFCNNAAVNRILAAYTAQARKEQIKVMLDVELGSNPSIPNIDLITILANAWENALYGCKEAVKEDSRRECVIRLMVRKKKNKLVIFCSNTCKADAGMEKGLPKPEDSGGIGVMSIVRTAEKFDGEYDFKYDNGVFVFRLVMNIPADGDSAAAV